MRKFLSIILTLFYMGCAIVSYAVHLHLESSFPTFSYLIFILGEMPILIFLLLCLLSLGVGGMHHSFFMEEKKFIPIAILFSFVPILGVLAVWKFKTNPFSF